MIFLFSQASGAISLAGQTLLIEACAFERAQASARCRKLPSLWEEGRECPPQSHQRQVLCVSHQVQHKRMNTLLAPLPTRLGKRMISERDLGRERSDWDVTPSSSSWLLNPLSLLAPTLPLWVQVTPQCRVRMWGETRCSPWPKNPLILF